MARARLGFALSDVRGNMNGVVVTKTRAGLAVRGMPKYKYPKLPSVMQGADRLKAVSAVWSGMSLDQSQAWRRYAESLTKRNPITLETYAPTAKNAFIGLATKFLQINPGGEVPVWPPAADFLGDDLALTILDSSMVDGSIKRKDEEGGVTFRASSPNTPGVAVEILMQKLLNVHRSPTKFYKSVLFHTFAAGSLDLTLPLDPGYYAFGWRFVNMETGQMTGLRTFPVLEV